MSHLRILAVVTTTAVALLPVASEERAQSAADHAASAHGKPIVNGHDVQPTPDVVRERWRHHGLMLKAQRAEAARKRPFPTQKGPGHP